MRHISAAGARMRASALCFVQFSTRRRIWKIGRVATDSPEVWLAPRRSILVNE